MASGLGVNAVADPVTIIIIVDHRKNRWHSTRPGHPVNGRFESVLRHGIAPAIGSGEPAIANQDDGHVCDARILAPSTRVGRKR